MRDRIYYIGAILTLIALCCNYSAVNVVMIVIGFSMVLTGYIK